MLRKSIAISIILFSAFLSSFAQDSSEAKKKLNISGSVDAYYRYNFDNAKDPGFYNNLTSFTNSQNSFELGMASLKFEYSTGKVGLVADLGFGKRVQEFSYTDVTTSINSDLEEVSSPTLLSSVKQAYLTYSPSEHVTLSMGKWATHVGYELLDPQLNRNYSMSYMFSYGPFSHTGIKADFSLGSGFGIMVGVANPTDYVTASFAKKNFIAQVSESTDKFSAYLNYVGGKDWDDNTNNQFGLTATATISDKFSLGYDGTVKSVKADGSSGDSWWGSALYVNVDPVSNFGFTVRGEYFDDKKAVAGLGTSFFEGTLSFDIKVNSLTIIPEFRLDSAKDPVFSKASGDLTKSTGSFILAAIFSF